MPRRGTASSLSAGVSIQSTQIQTDTYSFSSSVSPERERERGRAYHISLVLIHFIYLFDLVRKEELNETKLPLRTLKNRNAESEIEQCE